MCILCAGLWTASAIAVKQGDQAGPINFAFNKYITHFYSTYSRCCRIIVGRHYVLPLMPSYVGSLSATMIPRSLAISNYSSPSPRLYSLGIGPEPIYYLPPSSAPGLDPSSAIHYSTHSTLEALDMPPPVN